MEAITRWSLVFGMVDGADGVLIASTDGSFLRDADRPIVVAGRMFDPVSTNEMVITDDTPADAPALRIGDVVHLDAYGSLEGYPLVAPGPGPSVDFTVVGVVHSSLSYEFTGGQFITPGFLATYAGKVATAENAMVTLRHGAADVAALRRDASTDVFPGVPVLDMKVTARRVTATTDVERAMLTLLASIIALAGVTFVGQALARSAATIGGDAPTLRAIGMTRGQLTAAALRPHALAAAVAAGVTVLTAVVASRWFPVGLAGKVDPDRGLHAGGLLLGCATALVLAISVAVVASAGWLASAPDRRLGVARPSWFARLGLVRPLTVGVGVRMAMESGRRSGRGASRSALVGAVAAVAGIVAIVTLNHGLVESLRHPEVAGVAWDATVTPNADGLTPHGVAPAVLDAIGAQPGLAATSTIGRFVSQIGDVGVPIFTVIDRGDLPHVDLVTLTGRAPQHDGEVALGPSTARDLGVGIGGSVRLADGRDARVVGLGLFPSDVHAQFDEGALVTNARLLELASVGGGEPQGVEYSVAVRFSDRVHLGEHTTALGQALGSQVQFVAPVDLPAELTNLHNVQRLPFVLAVFLTVLGIVAVGHALFSSVRHRRRDFAVMRALGITRTGARAILAGHGSMVALVGLVLGVPIGLVGGGAGWRAITDRVPLTFRSPVTAVVVVLVVPLAVIVANALAVLPGRQAARLEPAVVLRPE